MAPSSFDDVLSMLSSTPSPELQKWQAYLLKKAEEDKAKKMPGLTELNPKSTYVANLGEGINTGITNMLGAMKAKEMEGAMGAGIGARDRFRNALGAAGAGGADPSALQYIAAAGSEPGMAGAAKDEDARQLKQTLARLAADARQKAVETTGQFKLTSDVLREEGQDRRFMPFSSSGTPSSGIATTDRSKGTVTTIAPTLNPNKPSGGAGGIDPEDPKEIALAIKEGRRSPVLNRMYKYAGPVAAALAKDHGYNHATAENEWGAMQKFLAAANSSQQLRMRQSIDFAYHSLQNIEGIYDKWKKVGAATGFKVLNRASLAAAKNMPGEAGATAQALEASINDMIEALGNVYMGGNTPTDQAFKLAGENLKSDWNPETFEAGLKLARTNLRYRDNAMRTAAPAGLGSAPNRYAPTESAPAAAPAAAGKVKKYNPATDSFE